MCISKYFGLMFLSIIRNIILRKEIEMCDLPPYLLFNHSMGGGTGSGLGTKITEASADMVRVSYA